MGCSFTQNSIKYHDSTTNQQFIYKSGNMMEPFKSTLNQQRQQRQQKINPKIFQANPISQKAQQSFYQKKFQTADKRMPIDNTKFPYSTIGYFLVHFSFQGNNVPCCGTACLIWHNIALTCAHNIYNRDRDMFANYCALILKDRDGVSEKYEVAYAYVPQEYTKQSVYEKAKRKDYAIVILNKIQKLGQFYGFLPISPLLDQEKKKQLYIDVSGFPKDRNYEKNVLDKKIDTMYGCQGKVKSIRNDMFYYTDVHTNPGQSGAPILTVRINKYDLIGIHTGGDNFQNHGVILTQKIINKIKFWMNDFQRNSKECVKMNRDDSVRTSINKFMINQSRNQNNQNDRSRLTFKGDQKQKLSQETTKNMNQIMKKHINKQQTKITLYNSFLNSQQLIYLIKDFIKKDKLKHLDLGSNKIDDQCIKCLCQVSDKWSQLNDLLLCFNNISMKGVKYISNAVQINCFPQIKFLSLRGNKIGSSDENILIEQEGVYGLLLKFANNNTKLEKLRLQDNNINDNDMKILFKNNQKNKKVFNYLLQLYLQDNKIKDQGIKVFTEESIQYPLLKQLYLYNNQINKDGIIHLSSNKTPTNFKSLENLYLQNNTDIGDQGINQFIKGCHQGSFPFLKILSIVNINLSDNGVDYLIKEEYKQSLKQIKILICYDNNLIKNKQEAKKKLQKRFKKNQTEIHMYYEDH